MVTSFVSGGSFFVLEAFSTEGDHRPLLGLLCGLFDTGTRTGDVAFLEPVPWPVQCLWVGLCLGLCWACVGLVLGFCWACSEGDHRPLLGLLCGLFDTGNRTGEVACLEPVPWPVLCLLSACGSACVGLVLGLLSGHRGRVQWLVCGYTLLFLKSLRLLR